MQLKKSKYILIEVIHFSHAWPSQKVFIPIVFVIRTNSMHDPQYKRYVSQNDIFGGLFCKSVCLTCILLFSKCKLDFNSRKYDRNVHDLYARKRCVKEQHLLDIQNPYQLIGSSKIPSTAGAQYDLQLN